MVEIGKYNTLKIVKDLDFGVYLDGGDGMEILLPARYVVGYKLTDIQHLLNFNLISNSGKKLFQILRPLRQSFQPTERQITFRLHDHPGRQKDQFYIQP